MKKNNDHEILEEDEKVVEPLKIDSEENCTCDDEECDCQQEESDCQDECDCECGDECECEACSNEKAEQINEELSALLEQEKETTAKLSLMLQQLQADFDNFRKRNANLAQESRQKGIFEAIKAVLPAFDAVIGAKKQITDESTLKGLDMVERALLSSLETLEITPIKTVGEQFDPNLHNAVMAEEVEGVESGEILEEYSAGFTSPNGVVRFATVKIAK